jgi:hypothetical protein
VNDAAAWTDERWLPGEDLVRAGIDDLGAGRETIAAMLVATGARQLRELGHVVPDSTTDDPERRLYALIEADVGPARAHSRYNALRRRLLSYLRTARSERHVPSSGRR